VPLGVKVVIKGRKERENLKKGKRFRLERNGKQEGKKCSNKAM
jgi:hypothetical protein